MPFRWSLNPYMGCVHRCTFCYVRHFEQRADRPSDDRYGRSIRVKPNIAEVLRRELARRRGIETRWRSARRRIRTSPPREVPAHARLPRRARRRLDAVLDRHARAARRARHRRPAGGVARAGAEVFLSLPTLDDRVWRTTEPRNRAAREPARGDPSTRRSRHRRRRRHRADPPGLSDDPAQLEAVVRAARRRRADDLGERRPPAAGRPRALPRGARPRLARGGRRATRRCSRRARTSSARDGEARSSSPSAARRAALASTPSPTRAA